MSENRFFGYARVSTEGAKDVLIRVADQGIGVPLAELPALEAGQPVVSREGTAGESGSGIGLSVCAAFLSQHQSRLFLENRVGGGVEARFRLVRYKPGEAT